MAKETVGGGFLLELNCDANRGCGFKLYFVEWRSTWGTKSSIRVRRSTADGILSPVSSRIAFDNGVTYPVTHASRREDVGKGHVHCLTEVLRGSSSFSISVDGERSNLLDVTIVQNLALALDVLHVFGGNTRDRGRSRSQERKHLQSSLARVP